MVIYASRTLGAPVRWILCYGDSGHSGPLTRYHLDLPFLPENGSETVVTPKQFQKIRKHAAAIRGARLEIVYF